MNAAMHPATHLQPMTVASLDALMPIELAAYAFPWTRGNFIDSLAAGYAAEVLTDERGHVLGYFLAMAGVDEMHLLNITVAPAVQGRGFGRYLLDRVVQRAHALRAAVLWLEVRASNTGARALYERYGFVQAGVRRGYYPAAQGSREDAVVMRLSLVPEGNER